MKHNAKKILCILTIIVVSLALVACGNNLDNRLTMDNYNKITCLGFNYETSEPVEGMTLEEVENILGKHDNSFSTDSMGYTSAKTYMWGNEKKCIMVSFHGDKAISKTQIGLF